MARSATIFFIQAGIFSPLATGSPIFSMLVLMPSALSLSAISTIARIS